MTPSRAAGHILQPFGGRTYYNFMTDEEDHLTRKEEGENSSSADTLSSLESTESQSIILNISNIMSSISNPSLVTAKGVNAPLQLPLASQNQASSRSSNDSYSQRRSSGANGVGTGLGSRIIQGNNRNNQGLRKQHKGQKRPKLAEEDTTIVESAAIKSTSSRKGQTSITHLMNFTLPPRSTYHHQSQHGQHIPRNPTWGLGSGHHAVDKARYIHANYRFIVNPHGGYYLQARDADVHLDWDNVLQILASAQSQATSCPICLSTPAAPRMAKCGHIFCLPCLIRYMHSTDDTSPVPEKKARWKKCPICWDSVYISETRPVRWFVGQEGEGPREGGDIVLRLMIRYPRSTLALPRDSAEWLSMTDAIPWHVAADVTDYARIMKGSESYMLSQFDREIEELRVQEKEDELMFGEESQWTKRAISMIGEAKAKVKGIGDPPSAPAKPDERRTQRSPMIFDETSNDVPEFHSNQHAAKTTKSLCSPIESPDHASTDVNLSNLPNDVIDSDNMPLSPGKAQASSSVQSPKLQLCTVSGANDRRTKTKAPDHQQDVTPFYFYQALVHYYLSPLDIRILKAAFGDYQSFPSTILPRVERVSTGHTVDDDLRKRAKYLAHLPYGCEVSFLECDWTDMVAPKVLNRFSPEIERRQKKNSEKEQREERERVRVEKEEDDKRWAVARRKRPSVVKDKTYSLDQQISTQPGNELAASYVDLPATSSSPPWLSSQTGHVSAFASLASPSGSPDASRTVWGTTAVIAGSPPLQYTNHEQKAAENDGWLHEWERDLLNEEDLVSRFQDISTGEGSSKVGVMLGSGKKKKPRKVTLMSTNARRGA